MKTTLITGVSRGLGAGIAEQVINKNDAFVIGISRTFSDEVKCLAEKYPDNFKHIAFDLSDYENLKNIYWNTLKKIGQIESVIHNAAYAYDDLVSNANIQTLEYMYKVNVLSPIILTKYSIRDMLLNNIKGSIVFVTSISAHKGFKGLSMYASTKGALEAFSKNVAKEWGAKGIRSNCVCPGFMETEMSSNISSEMKMKIFNRTSLKKATDIKSVASSVAFLTSDESNSITGQTIIVDCGTI